MILTTLSDLKKSFKSALEKSSEKQYLIENELREINNFVTNLPIPRAKRNIFSKYYSIPKGTAIFDLDIPFEFRRTFAEAFNKIIITGELEEVKLHSESDQAFLFRKQISQQALEFVKYYKWLNELKNKPQTLPKKSSLDHKEKLLALHYLGLDLSKFDNKKTSKILSEIIGHSEENTRKYLSYLTAGKNNVRTPKTLKITLNLFESQGFDEISNTIKSDLEKITK
ncbi:hypothetical protein SAMN04488034_101489 [Salinimicrobium catena]|uniref:Uncharacterized protein n=1 Tax=Salinimicrobium catena TaxID=390640 RepID=A0A1H5IRL8_9FLAO|nr:hypothetical protein [Salinimicrobium catena]SDK79361.1 hypothetical protein SAMN04488140_101488 [Salinimicrobium catena]SEE42118.1 hypothetical protein SAMN04488034_101489 [Salinimicrobium catena]